jgi:hypothetical protein
MRKMKPLHALEQPLVFALLLQYAGRDQWLFLGAVSRAWALLYSLMRAKTTSIVEASLPRIMYACSCDPRLKTAKLLLPLSKAAASCGNIEVLRWARATAGSKWAAWQQDLCMAAAAGNQLATLRRLLFTGAEFRLQRDYVSIAVTAAKCADPGMLQWICDQRTSWTRESLEAISASAAAAVNGAVDKLSWLCTRFPAVEHELRLSFAVASSQCGAVASLQWLAATGPLYDTLLLTAAASEAGQLPALRYLVEEADCRWDAAAVRTAAVQADNAELLQWAHEADEVPWSTAVLSQLLVVAGVSSSLRTAAWLREQGAEWPASFLHSSADVDNPGPSMWSLNAMQWALANGCPWGAWPQAQCAKLCVHTLSAPRAQQCSLREALQWAHANGCPCSSWLHRLATRLTSKRSSSCSSSSLLVGSSSALPIDAVLAAP